MQTLRGKFGGKTFKIKARELAFFLRTWTNVQLSTYGAESGSYLD